MSSSKTNINHNMISNKKLSASRNQYQPVDHKVESFESVPSGGLGDVSGKKLLKKAKVSSKK